MSSRTASTGAPSERQYELSDDLARLCLPQEFKDTYRNLAWVNSICFLFLVVGMLGIRPPAVLVRAITQPTETMQVILPPEQEPPPPTEFKPPEETETPDTPPDAPQVAVVTAMAATPDIRFAVPVVGVTNVVSNAAEASAPPPTITQKPQSQPSGPVRFNPRAAGADGYFPQPDYPPMSLRNQEQGTVEIRIKVDEQGKVTSADVQKSSRFGMLDDAALRVVKNKWHFPAGPLRDYVWPCVFQLK
jgi:periplasmic protein TonB